MKGAGCDKCNTTGYKGRVGLYEVMAIGDELKELILVGASGMELRRKAVEEGMLTLRMSGLRKVKEGLTSLEEVVRETGRARAEGVELRELENWGLRAEGWG